MCICKHIYIYIHIYIHTYIYVYTHICVYIYIMSECWPPRPRPGHNDKWGHPLGNPIYPPGPGTCFRPVSGWSHPQERSKSTQDDPRPPQERSRAAPDGLKTLKVVPRQPKKPPRRPKRPPGSFSRTPQEPQIVGFSKVFEGFLGFSPFRLPDAPRQPKRPPRSHQDGPRCPQRGPKMAQEGPMTACAGERNDAASR